MKHIADEIKIKMLEIQAEDNPTRKQELNKQLQVLNLRKEIETIKNKIKQLSPFQ